MKKSYLVFLYIFFVSKFIFSQSDNDWFLLPDGLGLSNQLEYSYNIENKTEILENWFNLDYRKGIFSAGIRFDVFQPNDPDPSISRGKERYSDIAYKYLKTELGSANKGAVITIGNYYALLGRGLILKSYEDRNIRIDNNLLGVKVDAKYDDFSLQALTGSAENSSAERKDIIHAVDIEYKGIRQLHLGGTYASNQPEIEGLARTSLASLRMQPSIWNFDFYAEYGIKQNEDIAFRALNDSKSIIGEAFYGSMSFYLGSFSLAGELKHYDNYTFSSNDGTIIYNTPPSLRKEYAYMLLNRHPSPLDQSSERGFQFEANYNLDDDTYFNGNFGMTETLPKSSYYQRVNELNLPILFQHKEFFIQGSRDWSESYTSVLSFGLNEELQTNTQSITPIIENKFYFGDINTIKLVVEHQQTTNRTTDEKYYSDVLAVEYLRSPDISVSLVAEVETKEPELNRTIRKVWSFIQFGYKLWQNTDVSLLIGSRQAGNICIGGVCRYEPEFRGIEFKMLTRL